MWKPIELALLSLGVILLSNQIAQTNAMLPVQIPGELGSCKDPFTYNATQVENEHGVTAVPCASGWCGKVIEGQGSFREDDYDMATQRMCVQRGPSDSEDRCANTIYNHKKVYMCFCQGDLCNGATTARPLTIASALAAAATGLAAAVLRFH